MLGAIALGVAGLVGINATDEDLSAEARSLLPLRAPPPARETNGFIDYLALTAPAAAPTYETGVKRLAMIHSRGNDKSSDLVIDPRLPRCAYLHFLSCVADQPGLRRQIVDPHVVFLQRYRAMREKPEFVDLFDPRSPEDWLPAYRPLVQGHQLSLMLAALDFHAGRRASAVSELEAEFAFHRKVAVGSRGLLAKMISFATLDGTAFFASELARHMPARDRALWQRLEAITRAPTKAELDVMPSLNHVRAESVDWMRTRRYVRVSPELYDAFKSFGEPRERPWYDPVAPWLYRPNYSVNRFVAQGSAILSVADRPSTEFWSSLAQRRASAAALDPGPIERLILSPAARGHYLLDYDTSDYIARMHGHAGVQALVALQVRLRAAGITQPAKVAEALAGPLGAAHADPFTGKPMAFDAGKMSLSFLCQLKYLSGIARGVAGANPKVELAL